MMLEELLHLYKEDCKQQGKECTADGFVDWIKYNREVYLRMSEQYEWTPSKHGMVGFIRVRQHEEQQKRYGEQKRRQGNYDARTN